MHLTSALMALAATLAGAQQFMGNPVNNSLPQISGAEITYWKIKDTSKKNINMTLINYQNFGKNGQRQIPANIQRAVVVIHGLARDPNTYEANAINALSKVTSDTHISPDTVSIVAPFFANGDDKGYGYPFTDGLPAGQGSTSDCLVWPGSQWSAGANNQYPYKSKTMSSYTVLDQMIQYYDNKTMFPNLNQIIIAGHSLGAQTVQRYIAISNTLNTQTPVSYWVANPNSYVWLSTARPFDTSSCSIYDDYREGYNLFAEYPMTYGLNLVNQGRSAILANWNSRQVMFARGEADTGNDASNCAPGTTGINRNERMYEFLKAFPASCPDPAGTNCDTVDLVPGIGHDARGMMASSAGLQRLFIDNFYGNRTRAYDFGYPRQLPNGGDDPYPNPALVGTTLPVNNNVYAGNMTYYGCWSDQTSATLPNLTYNNNANTIELCTSTCAQGGNTIAGLEYGSQCFCGSALGYDAVQVIEGSCGRACSGNSSEICGDTSRLSIFSNGQPTVLPRPVTPQTVGNFTSVGCYTDTSSSRTLVGAATRGNFVDLEYCANFCNNFEYFGTEYADECYCGNALHNNANLTSAGMCSMACVANSTEFCGAGNHLTLYQNTAFNNTAPSSSSSTSSTTATTSTSTITSSTSVSQTSTTTSASPTASSISCPASNSTTYVSNGRSFLIECGIDHAGGDFGGLTVNSFSQCIDTCANTTGCIDISLAGTACYLKNTLKPAVYNTVYGARLITSASQTSTSTSTSISSSTRTSTTTTSASATASSISCPASNSTVYVSNGQSFLIECGIDHAGGDFGGLTVNSFSQCIDTCANTTGCIDISLSGTACYLKNTLKPAVYNNVYGARLITSSSSTTTTTSTTSSKSSSTTASPTSSSRSTTTSTSSTTSKAPSTSTSSTTSKATSTSTSSTTSKATSTSTSSTKSTATSTSTSSTTSKATSTSTFITSTSSSTSTTSATASATTLACPASNNTIYVAPGNKQSFLIECGIDHAGGDLSYRGVSNFTQCVNACDTTAGCVDVSLSGTTCYLKNSLQPAKVASAILGAKLLPSTSSSTSSKTSTSTSLTSTTGAAIASSKSTSITSSSSLTSTKSSSTSSRTATSTT